MKAQLKEWHKKHSKNVSAKISSLKKRIAFLDIKREGATLDDVEVEELSALTADFHSLSRAHTIICCQQSRLNWLRVCDANSKFFHGFMSRRQRGNSISSFLVDGAQVERLHAVRHAVFHILKLIVRGIT